MPDERDAFERWLPTALIVGAVVLVVAFGYELAMWFHLFF
jgi:hypothetical protein